jgi:RNA polymerase sigma-70 factor (ECF subfamily)
VELALRGTAVTETATEDFRAWVTPHLVAMGRLAARLTSVADSDDVVQEALVRAWRKRSQYDEARGTAQSWLLAIVADRARRHRVRGLPAPAELIDVPASTTDVDATMDLEGAIRSLPHRQRLAVELHYLLGLDVKECASVMRCTEGTVKSTLSDARAGLRQRLEEVGRDERI